MWPMRRTTRTWLTTGLLALSMLFVFGAIALLYTGWLEKADVVVKFAVFPGGLIVGALVFLVNGCVEYHADILPPKYRARPTARPDWQAAYGAERTHVVASVLKQFVLSHGFRETEAFQFRTEDQVGDLLRDFYPGRPAAATAAAPCCLREYVDARIGANSATANGRTSEEEAGASLVDRPSRNHLVSAIERYMDESIMAFAFDEELSLIRAATKDPTVHVVVGWLWFHYDDCKDHRAGLSKAEWDYFQRLILLLESDGQIEHVAKRNWSARQIVAGLALLGFGLCVAWLGVGWHLFGAALPFGPVSILLAYWKSRATARRNQEQIGLAPFASFAELRAVRKTVSGFAKRRYPGQATTRRVHSRLMMMAVWLQTWVLWSFVSPLVLLFQALPEKETTTRIREAANIRTSDGVCHGLFEDS